jgi:hypothetical protein
MVARVGRADRHDRKNKIERSDEMKRMIAAAFAGATALLAGVLVGAVAQTPPPPMPSPPIHGGLSGRPPAPPMCDDRAAWLAGWAAFAQVKLRIASDQAIAWQSFADDVTASVEPLEALCPPPGAPSRALEASSVLELRQEALTVQLESVTRLRAAVDKLGPSLTDEQRGLLAEALPPFMGPPPFPVGHGPMGVAPPPRP